MYWVFLLLIILAADIGILNVELFGRQASNSSCSGQGINRLKFLSVRNMVAAYKVMATDTEICCDTCISAGLDCCQTDPLCLVPFPRRCLNIPTSLPRYLASGQEEFNPAKRAR